MSYKAGIISVNKADAGVCMVIDCGRRALYRSRKEVKRGYCDEHKSLAAEAAAVYSDSQDAHFARLRHRRGRE